MPASLVFRGAYPPEATIPFSMPLLPRRADVADAKRIAVRAALQSDGRG